ncbi:MAG: FAD-linked oxidase C-terminal domain-containing protein, partial [Thermodesulfobacteriota bacterium]|nr:FAD-linked oxidase C-terminal domain-containing protein [Thermodesulfobacteriota bacterium]
EMDRILQIDGENLYAVVEPGVITENFQKEVEKLGLFYPPDPASLAFSTLGGNVAECSGGPRGLKYGVTKDYVLGIEAVLPGGEIIKTGVKTKKGVAGYDLTKLLVGSEGTLAIFTKIYLRLIPLPESKKTMLVLFRNMEDAAACSCKILRSNILPSAIEFMDGLAIECVSDYLNVKLKDQGKALLLIELDGEGNAIEKQSVKVQNICEEFGLLNFNSAKNKREEDEFWKLRRAISPALMKVNNKKINEDVTIPVSNIPEAIKRIKKTGEDKNLKIINFGHIGDGNIHVNIMVDGENDGELKKAESAVKEIFEITLSLGGTISGEHGIGITKAPYLAMELSETEIDIQRKIKKIFDPKGILNPGKIFHTG